MSSTRTREYSVVATLFWKRQKKMYLLLMLCDVASVMTWTLET